MIKYEGPEKEFTGLDIGDVFLYRGELFVKISIFCYDYSKPSCVNISTHEFAWFHPCELVRPVKIEGDRGKRFTVIDKKTGEYPDLEKIALTEEWAKHLLYCDMDGFAIEEDGSMILKDDCGRFAYCPQDRFEIIWEDEEP